MFGTDVAMDLGTSTVKIFLDGKGIILSEPSAVAVNLETDEVLAIGEKAYAMLGRTSDRIQVCQPLSGGVISNFDMARYLISTYLKKIKAGRMIMPRVVVSVPCEITEVEKRAVVDSISSTGVRRICLIEEPVAAALGAGMDISIPHGTLVVDIGGGTTDMAVLSLSGIAMSRSLKIAGNLFDEAIMRYVRKKYNLVVGRRMAEQAKIEIGCVFPRPAPLTYCMKGRNAMTGLPQSEEISSDEIMEALQENVMQLVRMVQEMLEKTKPELVGDVYEDGMILTGGSAKLYGLSQLFSKEIKIPVHVAEDPQNCVANGAGSAIKFIDDMENKAYGVFNPLSAAY